MILPGQLTLITRPLEDGLLLQSTLEKQGIPTLLGPLLGIHLNPEAIPDLTPYGALVTTSANAIRALALINFPRKQPLYCVGSASAHLARTLGWSDVRDSGGDGYRLHHLLLADNPHSLLYLRGDVIRWPLVEALCVEGLKAEEAIVYHAHEAQAFPDDVTKAFRDKTFHHVLFYSPRTIHIFGHLCRTFGYEKACLTMTAWCYRTSLISTLEEQALPWRDIMVFSTEDK